MNETLMPCPLNCNAEPLLCSDGDKVFCPLCHWAAPRNIWNRRPDRIERASGKDGETEKLSELMRGLEIPPAYAAFDAHAFFVLGQKIAAQAKEAPGANTKENSR